MKDNKSILIEILIGIIIILMGLYIYLTFLKKEEIKIVNDDIKQNNANSFVVKKSVESFYFNVLLDTEGNTYFGIKDISNLVNNNKLANLFNNAKTYSYNNKNEKLVKIDLQNIKDIKTINKGNDGGKYIFFLDQYDKLYALFDFDIKNTGDITPLTDEVLNKVSSVYPVCNDNVCDVYVDINIEGKKEIISLYDLFENNLINKKGNNLTYELRKIKLDESNQIVSFQNVKVKLKRINNKLYIDDKIITDTDGYYVYIANNFMILTSDGQVSENIEGYITDKLNFVDSDGNYGISSPIYMEKNMFFANVRNCDCVSCDCDNFKKIEFIYENGNLTIKEVK